MISTRCFIKISLHKKCNIRLCCISPRLLMYYCAYCYLMDFDAVPAIYVPSRTGKSLLLHDGYTYYLKNLQAHGRKQWYCSSRDMAGCRADVITAPARSGDGDALFLVRGRHIHAPPSYYFTPDGKYVRRKDVYHRYRQLFFILLYKYKLIFFYQQLL